MKVLLTGGHMAPALSVIQTVPKDTEVVYVGRKHAFEGDAGVSLEYKTITEMGIPFIPLRAGRIQRKLSLQTIPSLLKIPMGLMQAIKILKKEKPDAVLGFGGYLSVPVGIAAFFLGIPLIIHEQTTRVGLANKVLAPFAQKICISWESSRIFFPKNKTVLTGNPILTSEKKAPREIFPESSQELPLVVIVGGSAGSHAINILVEDTLETLLKKYRVLHQTGNATEFGDFERLQTKLKALPEKLQKRYALTKFIHPDIVGDVYKKADVVISRSGINTITMLLMLKKPAILIPLPYGQHNEQQTNAEMFVGSGLGTILPQQTATPSLFEEATTAMIEKLPEYVLKKEFSLPEDAPRRILKEVSLCIKTKQSKNEKSVI